MGRTQQERRTDTKRRLLSAAAAVVAERGIDAASVDAIAERAERTSGAVYAHFGSKDRLLFEVLESWQDRVAATTFADVVTSRTTAESFVAIWRNFLTPVDGSDDWVALEHEFWRWATRRANEPVRERLATRYEGARKALASWAREIGASPDISPDVLGAAVLALLIGLEMQHRLDPNVVSESDFARLMAALLQRPETRRPAGRDSTDARTTSRRRR